MSRPSTPTRVVLVGAGHAHALVLRKWADDGPPDVDLIVVTNRTELLYSGMVPGLIAGEYERAELVIDAAALASRADAELIVGEVERIDAPSRVVQLGDGRSVAYDVASLDVGSVPAGQPNVPVVPARAADELMSALDRLGRPEGSVVVAGGGAAGVELAAAIRARLSAEPRGGLDVRVVEEEDRLLAGYRPHVSQRVADALRERGIEVRLGTTFSDDDEPTALVVWATGSAAPGFLERSGLPVDAAGFVQVDETLRVLDHPRLFAVGDCASLRGHDLPKAGVHAVRQAPVLFENLARRSRIGSPGGAGRDRGATPGGAPSEEGEDADLRRYEPQSDFLTLLNLGDGTALGTKWGLVVEGRWVRWLKDWIDRRFVERFRR